MNRPYDISPYGVAIGSYYSPQQQYQAGSYQTGTPMGALKAYPGSPGNSPDAGYPSPPAKSYPAPSTNATGPAPAQFGQVGRRAVPRFAPVPSAPSFSAGPGQGYAASTQGGLMSRPVSYWWYTTGTGYLQPTVERAPGPLFTPPYYRPMREPYTTIGSIYTAPRPGSYSKAPPDAIARGWAQ